MISRPPSKNTGLNLRRPSVVRRTGSAGLGSPAGVGKGTSENSAAMAALVLSRKRLEEAMDHSPAGEDAELGAGLGVDAGQLGDGGADHERRDRVAERFAAEAVAGSD